MISAPASTPPTADTTDAATVHATKQADLLCQGVAVGQLVTCTAANVCMMPQMPVPLAVLATDLPARWLGPRFALLRGGLLRLKRGCRARHRQIYYRPCMRQLASTETRVCPVPVIIDQHSPQCMPLAMGGRPAQECLTVDDPHSVTTLTNTSALAIGEEVSYGYPPFIIRTSDASSLIDSSLVWVTGS